MDAGNMVVKVVHKKTGKAYYTTDVAKISVIMAGNQPIFHIKRRYWKDGEELVTENAAFHGEEYYIAEVYDEEEWTND